MCHLRELRDVGLHPHGLVALQLKEPSLGKCFTKLTHTQAGSHWRHTHTYTHTHTHGMRWSASSAERVLLLHANHLLEECQLFLVWCQHEGSDMATAKLPLYSDRLSYLNC